jgi:hypothetical protein
MKKAYEKPYIESEQVFETIAGSVCTLDNPDQVSACDPMWGGVTNLAPIAP